MIRDYGIESVDESEEQACMHMYQCVILLRERIKVEAKCNYARGREKISIFLESRVGSKHRAS